MTLAGSILFWSVICGIAYFLLNSIFKRRGLKLRVWLREPITIAIAAAAVIGALQLILHIPQNRIRIIAVVIWIIAAIIGVIAGIAIYALEHREEKKVEYKGKVCIAELEITINSEKNPYFYEMHGRLFRSTHLLGSKWNEDFHLINS